MRSTVKRERESGVRDVRGREPRASCFDNSSRAERTNYDSDSGSDDDDDLHFETRLTSRESRFVATASTRATTTIALALALSLVAAGSRVGCVRVN